MAQNRITELHKQGQSVWQDDISRQMLNDGEIARNIDLGVRGLTSNPSRRMRTSRRPSSMIARRYISFWIVSICMMASIISSLRRGFAFLDLRCSA